MTEAPGRCWSSRIVCVAIVPLAVACSTLPKPAGAMAAMPAPHRLIAYEVALDAFISASLKDDAPVFIAVEGTSAPGALLRALRNRGLRRLSPYRQAAGRRGATAVIAHFEPESTPDRPVVTVQTSGSPGFVTLSWVECTYFLEPHGDERFKVARKACGIIN
jgi:hypothetical protein